MGRRSLAALAVGVLASLMLAPGTAYGTRFGSAVVDFSSIQVVGQTLPATLTLANLSTTPHETETATVGEVHLTTACGVVSGPACAVPDPGVFSLSATGAGAGTPAACNGSWTISAPDAAGVVTFTAPGGAGSLVLAAGESCLVTFDATALKVPTIDSEPIAAGAQTRVIVAASLTFQPGGFPFSATGSDAPTVARAAAALTPTAVGPVPVGGALSHTATLAPAPPSAGGTPIGTIAFTLFGPDDPTCAGPPVASPAATPVDHGYGAYSPSVPFTPTTTGTYRWVAAYSGDANTDPVTTTCDDPAAAVVVTEKAAPTLSAAASAAVTVGGQIGDTATLAGGSTPTGTITFSLFGPDDPACAGTPINAPAPLPVNGNGTYAAPPYTPTAPGVYRWVATYSGDAGNTGAATACTDAAASVAVTPKTVPTLTAAASAPVTVGGQISATAVLAGASPTGTITFSLFGPDNAACAGTPVNAPAPLPISGNGTVSSPAFTPTTPGVYRWLATYSGDANNSAAATACADPAGSVAVSAAPVTPGPVPRVRPTGLTLGAVPARDLTPPFRFVLTGRLGLPRAAPAAACRGRVRLTARVGRRLVAARTPALVLRRGVCSFRAPLVFRTRVALGARTAALRVRAIFAGNTLLLPRGSRTLVLRVRRP